MRGHFFFFRRSSNIGEFETLIFLYTRDRRETIGLPKINRQYLHFSSVCDHGDIFGATLRNINYTEYSLRRLLCREKSARFIIPRAA